MPNVKINTTMNYYPDGTTLHHVEAGDVVEMSVKWAEIFEREGWGFITHKTPATGGQEDGDDDSSDGSGSDENGSSSDSDDDSGEEGSEDDGGDEGDGGDDEPILGRRGAAFVADETAYQTEHRRPPCPWSSVRDGDGRPASKPGMAD